jgi:hypothetical protein
MEPNIDPGSYLEAAERVAEKIGLGGTVVLIAATGFAISIMLRGPEWLNAFGYVLNVIFDYLNDRKCITAEIARKKNDFSKQIEQRIELKQRHNE